MLSEQVSVLVRDELKLAQLEMTSKGKQAAFGTGMFGAAGLTAVYAVGCLLAYDRLIKARRFPRVLDVGSGTGVLAIAAARTGSDLAIGADIDRVSVRISRENAAGPLLDC